MTSNEQMRGRLTGQAGSVITAWESHAGQVSSGIENIAGLDQILPRGLQAENSNALIEIVQNFSLEWSTEVLSNIA